MLTGPTLLLEIERCLRVTKCSESYFGSLCVGDSKLVARLRGGGSVTLEKANRIMTFIGEAEATGWVCETGRSRLPEWIRRWRAPQKPSEAAE